MVLCDCSVMTDSSGVFQSQTRSFSLSNQIMANSFPTTAQWEAKAVRNVPFPRPFWFYSLSPLQVQTWTFSPLEEKEYTFEPKLTFWPAQTPGCDSSELSLKVTGVGSKGLIVVGMNVWPHAYGVGKHLCRSIWNRSYIRIFFGFLQADKPLVDVGKIVVGGYRSVELPLVNQSPCSVSFCLSVKETVLEKDLAVEPRIVPNGTFCCSCCWCNDRNYQPQATSILW